jgi:hypothetical protein
MSERKKREILRDDALLEYSKKHLRYEIEMFFGLSEMLSKVPPPGDDTAPPTIISYNALVESFAIHLRNLVSFFYPSSRIKPLDVLCTDFFERGVPEWRDKRPKLSRALDEARTRAHREISHLTKLRRDREDPFKGWRCAELAVMLKPALTAFVENASNAKLHCDVKTLVNSIGLTVPVTTNPSTTSIFHSVIVKVS